MTETRKAACIGAGVIGAGWAARLLWNGIDVAVADPHPAAERRLREVLANADRALAKLTLAPVPRQGTLTVTTSIAEAVDGAGFIQESAPEREDLKRKILAEIDAHAPADALVCSSTSGLLPSSLQADMRHPERFMVGHPFNPVYLLPLVEVCGGARTGDAHIERAMTFYASLGMKPLRLRKEIDGFVADRLLEALWREALWLVHDDIATVEEVDDAIRYGAGLRWAQMGTFLVYRMAGGEDGMRHFMSQFGPALKWPWTKLMDVPELTEAFIDKIAVQSDDQAGGQSVRDLERQRDDNLVAIMQALKTQGFAAGKVLAGYEERLHEMAGGPSAEHDLTGPLRLVEAVVRPEWVDYNNHMTESRYVQVFGDISDALFRLIGVDQAYHDAGFSYYTVDSHIRYIREVAGLEPIYGTTQILGLDAKRIHLFHRIHHARSDELLATAEQMQLHVDSNAGRACAAQLAVLAELEKIRDGHAALPRPGDVGRVLAIPGAA